MFIKQIRDFNVHSRNKIRHANVMEENLTSVTFT